MYVRSSVQFHFHQKLKTRQLEVTSKEQIRDVCVTMTQYFLYNLGELNVFLLYVFSPIYQAMIFCLI